MTVEEMVYNTLVQGSVEAHKGEAISFWIKEWSLPLALGGDQDTPNLNINPKVKWQSLVQAIP